MTGFSFDEYRERLFKDNQEIFTEDGYVFDLPASLAEGVRLSDIPFGFRVQLCDRVFGSLGELCSRPPHAIFENSQKHGPVVILSTAIIPPAEDMTPASVHKFFVDSLNAGERSLATLREAGRLLEADRDIRGDIAFLHLAVTLPDQSLSDAEAFVCEIDSRVSAAYVPPTLFVCHASEDKPLVEQLVTELDRRALFAWYDKREIFVGDSIVEKVGTALKSSDYLIAVLSPRSVVKPWVVRELNASLMRQLVDKAITILPVLLEPCEIPALLRDIKYADFTKSFDEGLAELLAAIRRASDYNQH